MTGYGKKIDEAEYVSFLINDEMLEKYTEVLEKVSNSIKKGFNSEQ